MNPRDASKSMSGYLYQRFTAIKLTLENKNNSFLKYIKEEEWEDIDFIDCNNKRKVYQVKYQKAPESLVKDSGLYTVIKSQYKNDDDLDEIVMCVHCKSRDGDYTRIKDKFFCKDYEYIRKYLILLYFKSKKCISSLKFKVTIKNKELKDLYNEYKKDIVKMSKNDDEDMLNFFLDKEKSYNFLRKFKLESAPNFEILEKEIHELINKKFINLMTGDEFDKIRIFNIKYKIFDIFNKSMFFDGDRRLNIKEVYDEVNDYTKKLNNRAILMKDALNLISLNIENNNINYKDYDLNNDFNLVKKIRNLYIPDYAEYLKFLEKNIRNLKKNGKDNKKYIELSYDILNEYQPKLDNYADKIKFTNKIRSLFNCETGKGRNLNYNLSKLESFDKIVKYLNCKHSNNNK